MEKELIVEIAIALLVVFLIIYFTGSQITASNEINKRVQCQESVIKSVETKDAWIKSNLQWADVINCPPNYITLNTDSDDFESKFVKEISGCWEKMGEGNLDLFQQEDSVYCVVCSVIEKFEGKKEILSEGIEVYMRTAQMQGRDMSYWDYLVGKSTDFKFGQLDKSQKYAILYIHGKNADTWSTEYQKWVFTTQGLTWGSIKLAVAWIAGWDRASEWDARWAVAAYDKTSLEKAGCKVLVQ
jgi:hypothetical protein